MVRCVIAGVDGSPESLAAADWAAREAGLRGLPLRLRHAWEWQPYANAPCSGRWPCVPGPLVCPEMRLSACVSGTRIWRSPPSIVRDATGVDFPQDPAVQLHMAVRAVFASWNGDRARLYRRREHICDSLHPRSGHRPARHLRRPPARRTGRGRRLRRPQRPTPVRARAPGPAPWGLSRDDAEASFLPAHLDRGLLTGSPFESLDPDGVGRLVRIAVDEGRATRPRLTTGVCGEHGGDPASVHFFHQAELDHVSCSPTASP